MLHPYSIENDELRTKSIIGILIFSLILNAILNTYVLSHIEIFNKVDRFSIFGFIKDFSVFGLIKISFDKCIWRLLAQLRLIDIPDLNGKWKGYYKSSKDNSQTQNQIECTIRQTWTKISVLFRNETRANSKSVMAYMELEANPILQYEYINSPHEQNVAIHMGTCKLEYDRTSKTLTGTYYNDNHNRHSGKIYLNKG